MHSDSSVDPRRCFVHGLTRVQKFAGQSHPDYSAPNVSWWECPLCEATPVPPASAPAATAEPDDDGSESGEEFDAAYWPAATPEPYYRAIHEATCEFRLAGAPYPCTCALTATPEPEGIEVPVGTWGDSIRVRTGSPMSSADAAAFFGPPAAPTGEEAETPSDVLLHLDPNCERCGHRASQHSGFHSFCRLSEVGVYRLALTAQATELAALRARVEELQQHGEGWTKKDQQQEPKLP